MKYSACIEMLFRERRFADRIRAAEKAGFQAVEFWLWQNKDLAGVQKALRETGLSVGIFQGNIDGRMTDPGDHDLYVAGVRESMKTAKTLGARRLFLMSDILKADRSVLEPPAPISAGDKLAATKRVLRTLAPEAEAAGITFVIEPLNTLVDHRGYSLNRSAPAFAIVREIGSPNVKVLYDVYHMQIMEGNIIETLRANMDAIGYVHIADVPGRHEPGTGEINYKNVLGALRGLGYDGTVGFEFEPTGSSEDVLRKVFEEIAEG
jgi:hydroxypyruvate isomerase